MRLSEEFIEKVKNNNDLVDVISMYTTLKKKGRSYFGLCPFHNEKTPSFSVSKEKQMYNCFGCGEAGSVIQFVQKKENMTFIEAMEYLAQKANIPMPEKGEFYDGEKEKLKEKCYQVNEAATKYFQESLFSYKAKKAQEYVQKRKLNKQALIEFRLGYSVFGLYNYLKSKGFKDKEIYETGLVYKTTDGRNIDRFIKRLMFPIVDVRGKVIGFGGRIIEPIENVGKYINSNENAVYSKSRNLYGLYQAKKYSKDSLILVEGNIDVVSLSQRGIKNVAASLGTALTESQARLVLRYTKQVILSYDMDDAGKAATLKALDIFKKLGMEAKVVVLKNAKDPDEYILKYGKEAYLELVKNAFTSVDFKVFVEKNKYDMENADDKTTFISKIVEEIAGISNEVQKELYVKKLSKKYDISETAIMAELKKKENEIIKNDSNVSYMAFKENLNTIKKQKEDGINNETKVRKELEEKLIYIMSAKPEIIKKIKLEIPYTKFKVGINSKIVKEIYSLSDEVTHGSLLDLFYQTYENINPELEEIIKKISQINVLTDINLNDIDSLNKIILNSVKYFKKEDLEKERLTILNELKNNPNLDEDSQKILSERLSEIIVEFRSL